MRKRTSKIWLMPESGYFTSGDVHTYISETYGIDLYKQDNWQDFLEAVEVEISEL